MDELMSEDENFEDYPDEILANVKWCFTGGKYSSVEDFNNSVHQNQKQLGGEIWQPDIIVLNFSKIIVLLQNESEDEILLTANNSESFTAVEILFKLHNFFVDKITEQDDNYSYCLPLRKDAFDCNESCHIYNFGLFYNTSKCNEENHDEPYVTEDISEPQSCIICNKEVDESVTIDLYLNPPDNSWQQEGGTPFIVSISGCCGERSCILAAWEQVKQSSIGDIELQYNNTSHFLNSDQSLDQLVQRELIDNLEISEKIEYVQQTLSELESLCNKGIIKESECMTKLLMLRNEFIYLLSEYAETWVNNFGNINNYPGDFTWKIDPEHSKLKWRASQIMRYCVVMRSIDNVNGVTNAVKKMNSFLGNDLINIKNFEHEIDKISNDIDVFKIVYDYIKNNSNILQKNIYKTLSVSGRRVAHMLELAERLNIVSRVRYNDSWLLSIPVIE